MEKKMRMLLSLVLLGVMATHNLLYGESHEPVVVKPFDLSYEDFEQYPSVIETILNTGGDVLVMFVIDEHGLVVDPEIINSFDIFIDKVVIDKVKQIKFKPALQNGRPIKVRYSLPILFK